MGPVTYDSDRCMGCRYCMMACPFGIPRCEWASAAPKIRKCILCYPRLKEGKQPACTEACPYSATIFGTRADMLAEARRRFAAHPGRYYPFDNPSIYGEHEIGGTSVLYISSISLDFLGWKRNLGDQPLPVLTWAALRKVPPVVLGMAGVALAAGGFVVAAAVYIFGLHKYHDFARPAILTALLGYIAVAVGLLYDPGLPWHIWHPIIFPQEHSVLFEVAMCVMCYLTVLALEFSPVVLEHPLFSHRFFRWAWAWRWSRWSLWCRDGCSATSRGSTFWGAGADGVVRAGPVRGAAGGRPVVARSVDPAGDGLLARRPVRVRDARQRRDPGPAAVDPPRPPQHRRVGNLLGDDGTGDHWLPL
jgi:hypothetical protein